VSDPSAGLAVPSPVVPIIVAVAFPRPLHGVVATAAAIVAATAAVAQQLRQRTSDRQSTSPPSSHCWLATTIHMGATVDKINCQRENCGVCIGLGRYSATPPATPMNARVRVANAQNWTWRWSVNPLLRLEFPGSFLIFIMTH